ncbi:MAG: elongation factor P-like protein YeiP [Gammaproteobacteria bacterium]|nr:elongation factor P-like protein YeiP [Gammaproteobacteria bacterium]MBT3859395.1 elongation factor P-like protein YeiP [Gammaproteobacteria bacterium]MBT3988157.1 elongation factor P-like protein YeiP [Gammaproteobacteria bacterium]MBT4583378.1 elongation factor P-like protein YeiP [Gammaproteobacteria bacterium]MBT4658439.1 elongation factor P-like protein YeiP [Gammaproteobacteria bacterium]
MPKANELKRGMIVEIDGVPHIVKQLEAKSPSSRGAATLYKIRFNNLQTHQKLDMSYKGDDILKEADCSRVGVQFSYREDDTFYFMDMEDFSQYGMDSDQLDGQIEYLVEQQEDIVALLMDGNILGIELPQSVNLVVEDTPPAVTGSSATNRSKTAKLSTGLEIQVPEYLSTGETVKVNTVTGKFMSRA